MNSFIAGLILIGLLASLKTIVTIKKLPLKRKRKK